MNSKGEPDTMKHTVFGYPVAIYQRQSSKGHRRLTLSFKMGAVMAYYVLLLSYECSSMVFAFSVALLFAIRLL